MEEGNDNNGNGNNNNNGGEAPPPAPAKRTCVRWGGMNAAQQKKYRGWQQEASRLRCDNKKLRAHLASSKSWIDHQNIKVCTKTIAG